MEEKILFKKDISIVLGSYNRYFFLRRTINSIRRELENSNLKFEIIVVDGGSTDGSLRWLLKQKDIITIIQHNQEDFWRGKKIVRQSWGYFMNLGFKAAKGKYICMISDDCLIVPGAIFNGYQFFEERLKNNEKLGALAFYFRNWPEQKKYVVGLTWGGKMYVNHGLYLREALKEINYIDEDNYIFYHADGDLCLRLDRAGYKTLAAPNSYIEHYSHANLRQRLNNTNKQKLDWEAYEKRWRPVFPEIDKLASDWLEKDYFDTYKTVEQLKFLHRFYQIKNLLTRIKLKIIRNFGYAKK